MFQLPRTYKPIMKQKIKWNCCNRDYLNVHSVHSAHSLLVK